MKKEIVDKRTANSKLYLIGDNRYRKEFYHSPVHYRKGDKWEEINIEVKMSRNWEFSHTVEENIYKAYFQDLTKDNIHLVGIEYVTEDGKDLWVNYKLIDARPAGMETYRDKVVFKDCFDNVDVEYIITPSKLKENIVLKDKTSIREFVHTLKMGGVSIRENKEGIIIADEETGDLLWEIDPPFMVDRKGNTSYGVSYNLGQCGEYPTIAVIIEDEDFLENAEYPVVIDPTTTVGQDGIFHKKWDANGGTRYNAGLAYMYVGARDPGTSDYTEVFSLLGFPEAVSLIQDEYVAISRAELGLFVWSESGTWANSKNNRDPLVVYRATSPWDRDVTFQTRPTQGTDVVWEAPVASNGDPVDGWYNKKWLILDLTKAFRDRTTTGLYFRRKRGSSGGWRFALPYTAISGAEEEHAPYLIVEYIKKPTLGFHDGDENYYTDNQGTVFKYLNFGTLIAGQTSLPQKVYLRNLSPFAVENVSVRVDNSISPSGVQIQISKYNTPFVPEDYIVFDGVVLDPDEDVSFFVRIATEEGAVAGGNFPIMAKAVPRN